MLTYEDAKSCVADEKPGYVLSRIADSLYVLTRPDGSRVTPPGSLVAVLVGADIPIPVRDEDEATAVVQAKKRDTLALASEGEDGEKLVGIEALLEEMRPGEAMATAPRHGLGSILGRGRTWKEALAQLGVRVRSSLASLPSPR